MINLQSRSTQTEAMDDPFLGYDSLNEVFRDLNRTNKLLGGQRISIKAVLKLVKKYPRDSYYIADMGCGDGDLLRRLATTCRQKGIKAHFLGVDNSETAVLIAREKSTQFPEIQYQIANLLDLDHFQTTHDILLCTLTLHHFSNKDIPRMIERFTSIAKMAVLINDLQRNRWAFYLFHAFSRIFIKTKIAKQDGLISIRSGFRKKELLEFSKALPGHRHTILWRWIFRYLWVIQVKGSP